MATDKSNNTGSTTTRRPLLLAIGGVVVAGTLAGLLMMRPASQPAPINQLASTGSQVSLTSDNLTATSVANGGSNATAGTNGTAVVTNGIPSTNATAGTSATSAASGGARPCTNTAAPPSALAEQTRRNFATQQGISADDLLLVDEYEFSNRATSDGEQDIPNFGDTVQIIIFQLKEVTAGTAAPKLFILAVDPRNGIIGDLNKSGNSSKYLRSTLPNTQPCTPVPGANNVVLPTARPAGGDGKR